MFCSLAAQAQQAHTKSLFFRRKGRAMEMRGGVCLCGQVRQPVELFSAPHCANRLSFKRHILSLPCTVAECPVQANWTQLEPAHRHAALIAYSFLFCAQKLLRPHRVNKEITRQFQNDRVEPKVVFSSLVCVPVRRRRHSV